MKIYILYSANEPSIAVDVGKLLENKYDVVFSVDAFELWNEPEAVVIDIVKGLDDVLLIRDIDEFLSRTPNTTHDLDLGFFIKLQKEVSDQKIVVIGIPETMSVNEAKEKVSHLLSFYLKEVS